MNKFYITSAIPYVNAQPHIGHALEFVQTDVIARYHQLLGEDVLKLCGGDENALKNVQAAEKAGIPVQEFVNIHNNEFVELTKKLNAPYDVWQKGSDHKTHFASSQELWRKCAEAGDIYKKAYTGLYCVGCELFYEKDELNENGECFEHPGKKLEEVTEENYFFRLSKYQPQILSLLESGTLKITPEKRKNEIVSFVKSGLQDISISRSNERAKNWGVPVPEDEAQRIYVWFDALNIYQSGIGFGWDEETYNKWWPADVHVIGKGIIRFHAVYWPAFLLSAKLELPKSLFVHEYFTVDGQKMSKTLGNVIDPVELIDKYGADPLRLYFLKHFSPFNDGDFSEEKFRESYTADLSNGLGNLVARVAKLAEKISLSGQKQPESILPEITEKLDQFLFNEALSLLWENISEVDKQINIDTPWKLDDGALAEKLPLYIDHILTIAYNLQPFMPETAEKILKQFTAEKIVSQTPLFPRLVS